MQRDAVHVQQDVGGLDVAVHHATGEQRVQSVCHLGADLKRRGHVQPALPLELLLQRAALDELLGEVWHAVVLAGVEHRHDVPVLDVLGDLRLALEAAAKDAVFGEVAAHQLERHQPAVGVDRPVHATHPADAQHRLDPVAPHARADQRIGLTVLPRVAHGSQDAR